MPLIFGEFSDAELQEIRNSLPRTVKQDIQPHFALGGSPSLPISVSAPHAAYTLRIEDLLKDPNLARVQFTANRYLAKLPDGFRAVEVGTENNVPKVLSITDGPFVKATLSGIRKAESAEFLMGDWNLRYLTIPAIYVVALWLHSPELAQDRFLPLSNSGSLIANEWYRKEEFLKILNTLAIDTSAAHKRLLNRNDPR